MNNLQELTLIFLAIPPVSLFVSWLISCSTQNLHSNWMLRLKILEFITASLAFLLSLLFDPLEINYVSVNLFGNLNLDLGLRADLLSTSVLATTTLLSLCIFRYSITYLDGDKNINRYFRDFQWTVFSVVILTLSNNLLLFFLAWLGTSFGLDKLLKHFDKRPNAVMAARKKWFISRIGDCALLLGIILALDTLGTLNYTEIFIVAAHRENTSNPFHQTSLNLTCFFFVLGAMAKSAQFPFHFWLPETMEAPTPVSALMHAGVINAGGYLIIRLAPLLANATMANSLLTLIGGITAVLGALIMMTQTDVKRQLAYSTISQLGFMMIQCGLGAYKLALFHIFAHGFYKAHLFLSTASALEDEKAPKRNLSIFGLVISYAIAGSLILIALNSSSNEIFTSPSHLIYLAILSLAITQIIGSRKELRNAIIFNGYPAIRYIFISLAIYTSYEMYFSPNLESLMPSHSSTNPISSVTILSLFVLFSIGIYLAKAMQDLSSKRAKRIWSFFYNGAYIPHISSRMLNIILK